MPAQNNNNTNGKPKKAYNPTVTRVYPNPAFGEGNFLSQAIDAEGFSAIQKHLQIGSKLLLKKSPVPAKNTGSEYFFLEILPPYEGNLQNKNTPRNKSAADDGI